MMNEDSLCVGYHNATFVAVPRCAKPFSQPQNAVALFMDDSCLKTKLCEVGDYISSMLVPSRLAWVSLKTRKRACLDSRDVLDTSGLDGGDDLFGQLRDTVSIGKQDIYDRFTHNAGDLDGVDTRDVAVESLPPGNPAGTGVCQSDEALKDLAGAFLNGVVVTRKLEELFAVGTSFTAEARAWKDDAADHAGAQRAVL